MVARVVRVAFIIKELFNRRECNRRDHKINSFFSTVEAMEVVGKGRNETRGQLAHPEEVDG